MGKKIGLKFGDKVIIKSDTETFNGIFHSSGKRFGMTKVYCVDGEHGGTYKIYMSYKVKATSHNPHG